MSISKQTGSRRPDERAPILSSASKPGLALACITLTALLSGCGNRPEDVDAIPTPTVAPTPTSVPVLEPIELRDAVRVAAERPPEAEAGAPCGKVDMLDFPMGPPEGIDHGPRWPFGRFSRRYNKIHAGEDWAYAYGPSLGRPVHAIGHGQVTYAQPLGWGGDKGVVIVRHTFADGSTKLSFYGHLDENSMSLRAGNCVQRGEQVGKVGDPRTRPHLHFEIRDHMPNTPGPGYWSTDPTVAGWESPSEFIFNRRVLDSPGLRWTRGLTTTRRIFVGPFADGKLGLIEERSASVILPGDGEISWTMELDSRPVSAVADAVSERIYWAGADGAVYAIEAGQNIWTKPLSERPARLFPRSGGGVIVYADQNLHGLDSSGNTDWRRFEAIERIASWDSDEEGLIFSTNDGMRSRGAANNLGVDEARILEVSPEGALRQICAEAGQVAISGESVVVYRAEGIYACLRHRARIQAKATVSEGTVSEGTVSESTTVATDAAETRLLMGLEGAAVGPGSIVALPDGGVAISHRGALGARVIVFDERQENRWQRKVDPLVSRALPPSLHLHGQRLYAMTQTGDLFEIDWREPSATRVFAAGRGQRLGGDATFQGSTAGSTLFLDYRGGQLIALDPPEAPESLDAVGD